MGTSLCSNLFFSFFLLLLHVFHCVSVQVPATREVLGSLPNVFSALCLNARGLHSFVQCQPFERLFKVLLSPDYLPAMRRRRSSDPLGKLNCICWYSGLCLWNLLEWMTCSVFGFRWHCIQLGQCCGWAHEAPTHFEDWCYYCHY